MLGLVTGPVFRKIGLLGLFFMLGVWAISGFVDPDFPEDHIVHHIDDGWWQITGLVDSLPDVENDRQAVIIDTSSLSRSGKQQPSCGRVRLTIYGEHPPLEPGASVQFSSRIRAIRNFGNPGAFDYERHMTAQKIYGSAYAQAGRLKTLDTPGKQTIKAAIDQTRITIAGQIDAINNESEAETNRRTVSAELLKALIVGQKSGIDPEVRQVFNRTGIGHLLAISGLHVGIVATVTFLLFSRLFSFIPFLLWRGWVRKSAAIITIVTVLGYGLLASMSASTQRAVIMVTVFLIALVADRDHDLFNTLALAGLIILALFPPALKTVSFQLSFAAVIFIVAGLSALATFLQRLERRWIRTGVSFVLVSALAISGTMPLTLYYFNQTSFIGILANCFMIPLIGFVAVPLGLLGALACLCGLGAGTGLLLFKASAEVLSVAYTIAETMAAWPFAATMCVTPTILEMICYYCLLGTGLVLIKSRKNWRAAATVMVIFGLVLTVDAAYWINKRFYHDDLRITALDVGQGNAALVELPGGKNLLVDGGGFIGQSTFDVGKMIVAPFLWQNKIGTIDTIVVTHPDTDHLGGLLYIAEHFNVKTIWSNGEASDTRHFNDFVDIARQQGINWPAFTALPRQQKIGDVQLDILYPPAHFSDQNPMPGWRDSNNNSLVLRVSLRQASFLFCGDIEKSAEAELLQTAGDNLGSDVIFVPHHGSKTSSTSGLINRVTPDIAVFCAGWQNRYGYPHENVVRRYEDAGCTIYQTGADGAIIMTTKGKEIFVATPMAESPRK